MLSYDKSNAFITLCVQVVALTQSRLDTQRGPGPDWRREAHPADFAHVRSVAEAEVPMMSALYFSTNSVEEEAAEPVQRLSVQQLWKSPRSLLGSEKKRGSKKESRGEDESVDEVEGTAAVERGVGRGHCSNLKEKKGVKR